MDEKALSCVPLQRLSYGTFCIILEDDQTVEKTCPRYVSEDYFHMKQYPNVVHVSSSELEEPLLNDCDESDVDYATDRHGTSVLGLTVKVVARDKNANTEDLSDSNPHYEESEDAEEDRAEVIEESQPPPMRSKRARRTPVRISDTVVVAVEDSVTYEEAMEGRGKNEWKQTQKKELDYIKWGRTWTHTVLPLGKDAIQCEVVLTQKMDKQVLFLAITCVLSQKAPYKRMVLITTRCLRQSYCSMCCFSLPESLRQSVGLFTMLEFTLLS